MIKLAFIVALDQQTKNVCSAFDEYMEGVERTGEDAAQYTMNVFVAHNFRAIPRTAFDADIILARGMVANQLRCFHSKTPLVEIPIGCELIAAIVSAVKEHGSKPMAVLGSPETIYAAKGLDKALDIDLGLYQQADNDARSIKRDVEKILTDGRTIVFCSPYTGSHIREDMCHCYPLYSTKASIFHAIRMALHSAETRRREREKSAQFQAVLAAAQEGVIVFDTAGRVVILNATASNLLQIPSTQAIGATMYDLLPENYLRIVLQAPDGTEHQFTYKNNAIRIKKATVRLGTEECGHAVTVKRGE